MMIITTSIRLMMLGNNLRMTKDIGRKQWMTRQWRHICSDQTNCCIIYVSKIQVERLSARPTKLNYDTKSGLNIEKNPIFHAQTNQIEVNHQLIKEQIQNKQASQHSNNNVVGIHFHQATAKRSAHKLWSRLGIRYTRWTLEITFFTSYWMH